MARTMTPAETLLSDITAAREATATAFEHAHATNEALSQKDEAVRETLAQLGAALSNLGNAYRRANERAS